MNSHAVVGPLLTWPSPAGPELGWLIIGLCGQGLFTLRFIVQWLHSERQGRSLIPASFWILSLLGGTILLAYGLHRGDPVIILGQLPGTLVYLRTLVLLRRGLPQPHEV